MWKKGNSEQLSGLLFNIIFSFVHATQAVRS